MWEIWGNSISHPGCWRDPYVILFNEINIHITRLCNIPPQKPSTGGPFFSLNCQEAIPKEGRDLCEVWPPDRAADAPFVSQRWGHSSAVRRNIRFDRHQTYSNTVYQYWFISSYSYQNVDVYAWLKHKFRGLVLLEVFLNKWTVQTYAMKSNRNHIESPNFADPPQSCGRGSLLWSCSFVQQKIAQDSGICKLNHIYLESLLPKIYLNMKFKVFIANYTQPKWTQLMWHIVLRCLEYKWRFDQRQSQPHKNTLNTASLKPSQSSTQGF